MSRAVLSHRPRHAPAVAQLCLVRPRYAFPVKRTVYALCVLLAISETLHALSYSTNEGSFAHQMALLAEVFAQEHDGRAPTSWPDFQPYLAVPIDEAFRYINPTKRYAFLSQPLHL